MTPSSKPLFKICSDRFEVLQGETYVSLDRARVDSVQFHSGVLTVRYKASGKVVLDCTNLKGDDLQHLLQVLQTQRDRNGDIERRRKQNESTSS